MSNPDNLRLKLARTLQAEAGNQGYQGMIDVGSVINNRAADGNYGVGIEGVIMKPGQFSVWNSVTGYAKGEQGQNMNFKPNEQAFKAADAILSGNYTDRTRGATHYYAYIPGKSEVPKWSNSSFRQIDGDHFFGRADGKIPAGRDVPPPPRPMPDGTPSTIPNEEDQQLTETIEESAVPLLKGLARDMLRPKPRPSTPVPVARPMPQSQQPIVLRKKKVKKE